MNHLLSAFRPGQLLIVIFVGLFYVTAAAKESGHNEVWSVTVTFGGATFQRSIAEGTPNAQVAEIGDKIADGVPMSLTKGTIAMEMVTCPENWSKRKGSTTLSLVKFSPKMLERC